MNIIEVYYGIWSEMSSWKVTERVPLVIGIFMLITYILFLPLLYKAISLVFRMLDLLVKGIYLGVIFCIEVTMSRVSQNARIDILNKFSEIVERISEYLSRNSKRLFKRKRISFSKYIFIYIIILILVLFPYTLNNKINEKYKPLIMFFTNTYNNMESKTLKVASEYPPLFYRDKNDNVEALNNTDKQSGNKKEISKTNKNNQIWLSLSEEGKNGTNVRKEAKKNSTIVAYVSGSDKVLYVSKKDGWIKVELTNGKKGWIRDYLLEE